MYCTKCGKEVKEGTAFCDNCGEKINIIRIKPIRCSICGEEITDKDMFQTGKKNEDIICSTCLQKIRKEKFNNYKERIAEFFRLDEEDLSNKEEEIKETVEDVKDVNRDIEKSDSQSINTRNRSSVWITSIRICAWMLFIAIIIIGIMIAELLSLNDEMLVLCIVISIFVGFFSVAQIMVYLDLAADVKTIKKILQQEKNK